MRLTIFGAAGATGRVVVEQALEKGYEVIAFDRHTAGLTIQHAQLKLVQGDVFKQEDVEAAIEGQDAVICVLGVKPTVTVPVCSGGTKNIIEAMDKYGVRRFICQSAFAVAALDGEWKDVPWMVPLLSVSPKVKAMFADKLLQEQFVRQSDLDWIIVRPARLTDAPSKGSYTSGAPLHFSINAKIGRADVADFLLKQVSDNTYLCQVPRLRY